MTKVIRTMRGLGDTIYQRAFIHKGYVDTPWPELLSDRPEVKCVKPETNLRTQSKNAAQWNQWVEAPEDIDVLQIHYGPKHLAIYKTIIGAMERQFGEKFTGLDLPDFGESRFSGKYAVIKPNTVRSEWAAPARNCKQEYINIAADILRDHGYTIVGIADIEEGKEWIDGIPPNVDEFFYGGELRISELVNLIRNASVVVSSVGWPVPMCIATNTRHVCIGGGLGAYNHPRVITDKRMDLSKFRFIEPDNYCLCGEMTHSLCKKEIADFDLKFFEAIQ